MKETLIAVVLLASPLAAQIEVKQFAMQAGGISGATVSTGGGFTMNAHPVEGAPYSATVTNESVQTLADGNRITQTTTGATARDSQGRTRNEASLPMIGNLSATDVPHLVFIVDPVAQVSYTLNLDEKTAHVVNTKGMMPMPAGGKAVTMAAGAMRIPDLAPLPPPLAAGGQVFLSMNATKIDLAKEQAETKSEDLGTQVIEGVNAQGKRTTRTIAAGEIGNDKPIDIVTEVWTSPDLKTIVLSKRSDPRMGTQTFRLTNIVRGEPDASLFTVPSDFKTVDPGADKNVIFYHRQQ